MSRFALTFLMMGRANCSTGSLSIDGLRIDPDGEVTVEGEVRVEISGAVPCLSGPGVFRPATAGAGGSASNTDGRRSLGGRASDGKAKWRTGRPKPIR